MYYYASISLDRFYSQTLIKADPHLAEKPLIVHKEKRVLDMNEAAKVAGAKNGMLLSEAKTLLHGANFLQWEEEVYRSSQEEWLELCTDFTDVIEPDQQHSAYLDLSQHPDVTDIIWRLQKALFTRLGWQSRVGIASTKWIARVSEILNGDGEMPCPYLEPCEQPLRFLSSISTQMLLPVPELDRMRLRFLGYHKIGEVCEVPLQVLREQFGDEGLLIHQAAHGGVQEKVRALYPKDSVSARLRFDGGTETEEMLDCALRDLANMVCESLRDKDLQGSEIELSYEPEEATEASEKFTILKRKFMKSMQSAQAILPSLRLMAAQINVPVIEIRVRMSNLRHAQRFQRELGGSHSPEERATGTVAAFNHIRTVFGDHAIEVAGQKKEPRRRLVLRIWKDATGWS